MTEITTLTGDNERRFDVELFIVHPFMKPNEITQALGLEPYIASCVGQRRVTPTGRLLEGNYPDTRWRYSERHTVDSQWFVTPLGKLIERLMPHKAFLRNISATHGSADVLVQFLGDGYFGDAIEPSVLAKMAELEVRFGIEVYTVPQKP